jgi:hypothetical protein
MTRNQTYRFWRSAAQCLLGDIGVTLLTFVCFRLRTNQFRYSRPSLPNHCCAAVHYGWPYHRSLSPSAVLCLQYFFAKPIFSFRVD